MWKRHVIIYPVFFHHGHIFPWYSYDILMIFQWWDPVKNHHDRIPSSKTSDEETYLIDHRIFPVKNHHMKSQNENITTSSKTVQQSWFIKKTYILIHGFIHQLHDFYISEQTPHMISALARASLELFALKIKGEVEVVQVRLEACRDGHGMTWGWPGVVPPKRATTGEELHDL